MAQKVTSARVASIAGKKLTDKRISQQVKATLASALSQREPPKRHK